MAKTFFIVVMLLFSTIAFTQRITSGNLIGKWHATDTSDGNLVFDFIDSLNLSWHISKPPLPEIILSSTYSIDTTNEIAVITIVSDEFGITHTISSLIRFCSPDTLKIQGLFNGSTQIPFANAQSATINTTEETQEQWETETRNNTMVFVRKKVQ